MSTRPTAAPSVKLLPPPGWSTRLPARIFDTDDVDFPVALAIAWCSSRRSRHLGRAQVLTKCLEQRFRLIDLLQHGLITLQLFQRRPRRSSDCIHDCLKFAGES